MITFNELNENLLVYILKSKCTISCKLRLLTNNIHIINGNQSVQKEACRERRDRAGTEPLPAEDEVQATGVSGKVEADEQEHLVCVKRRVRAGADERRVHVVPGPEPEDVVRCLM